jgi:serine/threonine protein kinase
MQIIVLQLNTMMTLCCVLWCLVCLRYCKCISSILISTDVISSVSSVATWTTLWHSYDLFDSFRNIFIQANLVKIGYFGFPLILMGSADMASTFVGTPFFLSPEVLKHEGYNSKSDVWHVSTFTDYLFINVSSRMRWNCAFIAKLEATEKAENRL